jgi:hypothetical protein
VKRSMLHEAPGNGGFPEPPPDADIRIVRARHDACGAQTRVRLPHAIPARAVRRLRCEGCEQQFEAAKVEELEAPARRFDPSSGAWKLASIPVAALLVIGALLLIQGDDGPQAPPATAAPSEAAAAAKLSQERAAKTIERASKKAQLVGGSAYSLALPAGWKQVEPPRGATFAAESEDGGADATLWITEDSELDFPTFVNQSLAQLEQLAGSAEVIERVAAPTPDATVVRLAADSPPGQATYEVTLRVSDPYRYYLATSAQPDASRAAERGVELITGSFMPEIEG